MPKKILVKRSAVQGKIPATTDLDLGEVGINTYDGKMFIKKNNGAESVIEVGGGQLVIHIGATSNNAGYILKEQTDDNIGTNAVNLGYYATASGDNSHVEGVYSTASGYASHAEGYYTAAQNDYMHAAGIFNVGTATDTIHETGIGTSIADKKNAFEIYTDGRIKAPELTTSLINDTSSLTTKEYVDAGDADPVEHDFDATAGQTAFTITGKVLTYVGVFVNGIKRRSTDYTISDNGTDTTVTFGTGLNTNDWVQLLEY